jgi:hypothetical protein
MPPKSTRSLVPLDEMEAGFQRAAALWCAMTPTSRMQSTSGLNYCLWIEPRCYGVAGALVGGVSTGGADSCFWQPVARTTKPNTNAMRTVFIRR